MVHKQTGQSALTKADLRQLVIEREDLVRRIAAFGAEIPTTPMFWKRHGNELEWIVRQMSWTPPWCAPNPARPEPPAKKVLRQEAMTAMRDSNQDPLEENEDCSALDGDVHDFDIPLSISDDDIARDLFGADDDDLDDAPLQTQLTPVAKQTDTDSDTASLPSVPDNRTQVSFISAAQLLVSFLDDEAYSQETKNSLCSCHL